VRNFLFVEQMKIFRNTAKFDQRARKIDELRMLRGWFVNTVVKSFILSQYPMNISNTSKQIGPIWCTKKI